jgi:energy-coupling factor transporter ATP-binding protein EcfA2
MTPSNLYNLDKQNLELVFYNLSFDILSKVKLVLIVGRPGCGKTRVIRMLQERLQDGVMINFGLELSKKLIENENIDFQDAVDEMFEGLQRVYLDNLEILCDPYLNKDPVRELINIAKHRQVVATLTGEVRGRILYYPRNMRFELDNLENSFIIYIGGRKHEI